MYFSRNEVARLFDKRKVTTVSFRLINCFQDSTSSEEDAVEVRRKQRRPESSALYQTVSFLFIYGFFHKTAHFSKKSDSLSEEEDDQDDSITVEYKASRSMVGICLASANLRL